jgi:hypothetical protein
MNFAHRAPRRADGLAMRHPRPAKPRHGPRAALRWLPQPGAPSGLPAGRLGVLVGFPGAAALEVWADAGRLEHRCRMLDGARRNARAASSGVTGLLARLSRQICLDKTRWLPHLPRLCLALEERQCLCCRECHLRLAEMAAGSTVRAETPVPRAAASLAFSPLASRKFALSRTPPRPPLCRSRASRWNSGSASAAASRARCSFTPGQLAWSVLRPGAGGGRRPSVPANLPERERRYRA